MNKEDLQYTQHGDMDYILEEGGNKFSAMRMVSWTQNGTPKLDIRNYYVNKEGNERPSSGFTMNPDGEAPNNLTLALIKEGYGDTEDIINGIKDRPDFMPSLKKCLGDEALEEVGIDSSTIDTEYYDPTAAFFKDEQEA